MCYCGVLSFFGFIETVASILLVISVYIEYNTCYISSSVYSLVWIQTFISIALYFFHCLPGLYMILKAMKIKILLFILQMILTIITALMLDFNDLTRMSCEPWLVNVMFYSSATVALTAFISAMYVIFQEPKTKTKERGYFNDTNSFQEV